MKEFKKFVKKYKDKIMAGITLVLLAATIGLSLIYLLSESIGPDKIFFVAAVLMIDLAFNYSTQKKKSKGVYIFYGLSAAACIIIGCILRIPPAA